MKRDATSVTEKILKHNAVTTCFVLNSHHQGEIANTSEESSCYFPSLLPKLPLKNRNKIGSKNTPTMIYFIFVVCVLK